MKTKTVYDNLKLTFDEGYHIYSVNNKRIKNSVTGVTGLIDKSPMLMGWAIKVMGICLIELLGKNKKITEKDIINAKFEYKRIGKHSTDIGTQVHSWIERYIKRSDTQSLDVDDININDIDADEEAKSAIKAFLVWEKRVKPKFLGAEELLYSKKYNYAGMFDALIKVKNKIALVDFKTSTAIWKEYRYQIAAYWYAWEEMTGQRIDNGLVLRLDKSTGLPETLIKRL